MFELSKDEIEFYNNDLLWRNCCVNVVNCRTCCKCYDLTHGVKKMLTYYEVVNQTELCEFIMSIIFILFTLFSCCILSFLFYIRRVLSLSCLILGDDESSN